MINIKFLKDEKRAVIYDNEIEIGECKFLENEDTWNIIHTEVNPSYQGQGIARKLVENVMENAEKVNKKIIAKCSYAKKVIEKS